jgi:arylsulfatase A-like enzyme
MKNEDVTTADVALPPTGKRKNKYPESGNSWKMFDLPGNVFSRFETGRNTFERWSNYLDLKDEAQKCLYDYACKNTKNTIVLRNSDNGALRSIRKRAANESKGF